jgi:hypothetical protein
MIEYIKYTYPNISLDDYSEILCEYTYWKDGYLRWQQLHQNMVLKGFHLNSL